MINKFFVICGTTNTLFNLIEAKKKEERYYQDKYYLSSDYFQPPIYWVLDILFASKDYHY